MFVFNRALLLKINDMKITKLKPNPSNPRLIKDYRFLKLVKSILVFPEMLKLRPIVIDENNIILGGNMRYKALQHILKLDLPIELESFCLPKDRTDFLLEAWNDFKKNQDVPVEIADDLTPEQKREFIIKDNVGFGENDWDVLANEWNNDELNDWGLEIPNFDASELKESENKSEFENEAILKLKFDVDVYNEILEKLSESGKTGETVLLNALGL